MSWAVVTVAVFPLAFAHVAAASVTALVSASPDEAMRICSDAGPLLCCADVDSLSNPLPPHAALASSPAVVKTANVVVRKEAYLMVISKKGSGKGRAISRGDETG